MKDQLAERKISTLIAFTGILYPRYEEIVLNMLRKHAFTYGTVMVVRKVVKELFMDRQEFNLRKCTHMEGMTEAWILDRTIFVSPAVFQLLTDKEDPDTISLVANQLTFKPVSYWAMDDLLREEQSVDPANSTPDVMIHFVRAS